METIKNLIFIDAAVSQPQTLLASLPGNSAYFLLDANRSGLEQIAEIAGRYSDLDAIHIVSHGSSGSLQLGNQTLNNTNLSERSALLEAVGRRLSPTGDILLYGCDLAANEQGQEFLRALATLTAADVAASINQTGGQGGDWVLESQTGLIESITIAAPQYSQALAANTGPSFAVGDGRFVWSLGSTNELVTSAEIDSSGRIVVAGSQGNSAMMARFNAGGSLDTTFGTGGILTNSAIGSFNDLAIQSDGIINAVGGSTSFYLGIYTADGSLSSALTSDISAGNDSASGVLLQTGKVILAGTASSATTSDFGVTRFTSTAVDTTFGATGKRTTDVSGADTAYASALQADGKIIVVGASISSVTSDISIARFTANGTIDNFATSAGASFGTNGRTTLSFGTGNDVARSVVVQSDGKILVAGYAQINSTGNFDFVVARYSALGVLDPNFGASLNGKVSIAVGSGEDQAFSMALQSDGKILLGGYSVNSAGNKDFALVRLTSAGVLDTTFSGGKVVTEIASGSNDVITSLNVQSDGKIVASGYASNGAQNDITLVRYNIDGSVDTTFNPINTLNATPTYLENGVAVVLDSDVMIYDAELVAGGNYAGASVQLSRSGGSNASDVFSALSGSTLGALVQGQDLTLAGTVVGSVTENSAGRLLLTFNAAATQALVNGVLQKIAYANSSDSPAASVTLEWVFSDGNTGDQGSGGASQVTGSSVVTITAVNDAPTLVAPTPIGFTDTSADDVFTVVSGTLAGSDPDNTNLAYGVTSGTDNGTVITKAGEFGVLVVTKSTGAYTYTPNDAAIEALLASSSESFTVTVTDGSLTTSQSLQINLSGAVDSPALQSISAFTYTDTSGDDTFSDTSGVLGLNGSSADALTYGITGGILQGAEVSKAGMYGTLFVHQSTGAYRFSPDDAAIESLKGNVSQTFSFTVTNGRDVQSTDWVLNFNGANDAPVFANPQAISYSDTATDDVFQTLTGNLPITDREGDALTFSLVGGVDGGSTVSLTGTYGTLVLNKTTGAYSFIANQISIENTISNVSENFAVSLNDGVSTAQETFTVNVRGVNEAPSFGIGSGKLLTSVGSGNDIANGMWLLSDGRFFLAGQSSNGSNNDFALAKYNLDGTADSTFSFDGKTTDNNGTGDDIAQALAVQSDGKVLLVGSSTVGSSIDFSLIRYLSDGSLDTSFSGDGKATNTFGVTGTDIAYAVALQSDGKAVVAGVTNNGSNNDFALARYNTNGSLDTTFSGDGKHSFDFLSTGDVPYAVAIQSDGKILLAGQSISGTNSDFGIARVTTAGVLDTTFSGDGKQTTAVGSGEDVARSMLLQSDGKILVSGWSSNGSNFDFAMVRYNADGSLDTTFGTAGKVTTAVGSSNDKAYSMAVQADGKIILGGLASNGTNNDFALVRYSANGVIDTSFGTAGKVITAVGSGLDESYSLAVEADGKILVSGVSSNGSNTDFAAVRYNIDGSLDLTFNPVNTLDAAPSYSEQASGIVLDSDVQIYDQEAFVSGNFAGSSLTLSRQGGAQAEDVFSAKQGGSLQPLLAGGSLSVAGTVVGAVGKNAAGELILRFNSDATQVRVALVMQQITYENTSDAPASTVTIDWLFSDGNGGSSAGSAATVTGSTVITIASVNDVPVLQTPTPVAYTDTAANDVFSISTGQLPATDADNANLTYVIVGGTDNGSTISKVGTYGTLTVTKSTGAYTFAPNDAAIEARLTDATESFAVTASDGTATD
nr:DUF4347 domain-containing protein [Burkholderiales bacterium]